MTWGDHQYLPLCVETSSLFVPLMWYIDMWLILSTGFHFGQCTHELPCPKLIKRPVVPCNFTQFYYSLPLSRVSSKHSSSWLSNCSSWITEFLFYSFHKIFVIQKVVMDGCIIPYIVYFFPSWINHYRAKKGSRRSSVSWLYPGPMERRLGRRRTGTWPDWSDKFIADPDMFSVSCAVPTENSNNSL